MIRSTRRQRRIPQARLAAAVGLQHARISEIERGLGTGTPLLVWVRLGVVLGRPISMAFSRDIDAGPVDAGHLAAQELVLGMLRGSGRGARFELPTRPDQPMHSTDVAVRDDSQHVLLLLEIWNRLDDVGRAVRSTDRKTAEAADMASAQEHGTRYRVAQCWLLVDTGANRALVARYPDVLRSRFPGSSRAWVTALTDGSPAPTEPGLASIDLRAGRLVPLRRRAG